MLATELRAAVDAILTQTRTGDDNLAHAMEDRLLGVLISEYAPSVAVKEFTRLGDGDFGGWFEEWWTFQHI